MYCKRCDYNLATLTALQCPECGAAFNPSDNTTFHAKAGGACAGLDRRFWRTLLGAHVVSLMPLFMASLAALNARIELGRWPRPSLDDPKGLRLVMPFDELFWVSPLLGLFAMILVAMLGITAMVHGLHHRRRWPLAWGALSLLMPVLVYTSMRWYWPLEWMLD